MLKYKGMKILANFFGKLTEDVQIKTLLKIIFVLLIVFLIKETDIVWKGILSKIWFILQPFVYGFAIAYVLHPFILFLEDKKISRKAVIPILYIFIIVAFMWLVFTLIPMVYSRLSSLITSMTSGINNLFDFYTKVSESSAPVWVQEAMKELVKILNNTKDLISVNVNIPKVFSNTISVLTRTILTFIISIYMCYGWENIAGRIYKIAFNIKHTYPIYLHNISHEIGDYISSLIILMVIKFIEYSILYLLIGHRDWMIIAILYSIGLIIPYLGGTLANTIGILTSLTLPINKVIILVVAIIILSNIDAYVTGPMVHSHNVKIPPLWALFAILAGGTLAGPVGIMLGIPVYLALRVIVHYEEIVTTE